MMKMFLGVFVLAAYNGTLIRLCNRCYLILIEQLHWGSTPY